MFFQLGELFHAQKCLSTNFRAKTKKILRATFFRKKQFFQKFPKNFAKILQKSNVCLILKLENHVGYVNSPTRKGGSQIQSRTSADGYPDSLIKINEILDFDRFSDGP